MYEKLIEALREEARNLSGEGYASCEAGDLPSERFVESIERIASRLEDAEQGSNQYPTYVSWSVTGEVPAHMRGERLTNPTEPPTIPSLSPADRLDIRCRASHTTSAPPNDDDEPLTAEWLESAQPAFLAADADYIIALYRTPACGRVTMAISGSAATLEYVTTRGDYRALRRMLGVPMEESPTTRVWVDDHCYPERAGWREFPTDQLPEIPPGGWLCAASRPDQPDAFDVMNPSGECESMGWVPGGEGE